MRKRATQCVKPKDPLDGYVSGVDANRRANFSRLLSLCLLLRLLNRARSFMCRADARRETRTILRDPSRYSLSLFCLFLRRSGVHIHC